MSKAAEVFGKPGGPARVTFAIAAIACLAVLIYVVFNLNGRLDKQQSANLSSVENSSEIVGVNDELTNRLGELTRVTETAKQALAATADLEPVLMKLDEAIGGAAALLGSTTDRTEATADQLKDIATLLIKVRDIVVPLSDKTGDFGDQATRLSASIQELVANLNRAVASAKRINDVLPVPG